MEKWESCAYLCRANGNRPTAHIKTLTDMNKYEKAVAFMNDAMEHEFAELGGMNDDIVYIITDLGDLRLHEDEVDAMAENWNRMNPHTHD